MKKTLTLYIVLLLFGCSSHEEKQDKEVILKTSIIEDENNQQVSIMYTTFENLRLRSEPKLSSEVILTLKKNTQLTYLDEKSTQKESIKIGGKTTVSPWYKVKIIDKEIFGWVFGGGISKKQIKLTSSTSKKYECDGTEAEVAKKYLNKILTNDNLQDKYSLSCHIAPYFLIGNFNNDQIEDVAIFIKENKKENPKTGIIIGSPSALNIKPIIFGAGNKYFDLDDCNDIGIFEKVDKGETLVPNWNEEINDFYYEDDIIPEEKMIKLIYDAIFIHVAEACGGGFIYWKNDKYNWMQNE